MDYDRGIFASLTLRLWCERQKPVRRILHVSGSSWRVSRISLTHLTMKPPFVPILVITIVMPLMRKLRLAGDDITYSAHRQKFDFSPSFNVSRCDNTTKIFVFLSTLFASLLSNILILREGKLRVRFTAMMSSPNAPDYVLPQNRLIYLV